MAAKPINANSHSWRWITSIWLGFGLVDALQTVFVMRAEGMHHAWAKLFAVTVVSWLPWALATPLVMRLGDLFPPIKLRPIATWPIHLAACSAIGLAFTAWTTWLHLMFNPYADPAPYPAFTHAWINRFTSGILASLVLYAAILAVNYALQSRARLAWQQTETARLSEQLLKAQLDALRRQIEPHFLFNSLSAIAGLVREQRSEDAVSMLAGLSDFLRRVLQESSRQEVPLREEMEFTQKYLDIQKVRFADKLELSVDIPGELLEALVPTLILQPMVENAIKHGIAKRAQGGAIRIVASRVGNKLTLRVSNDGPSLVANGASKGIGISNIKTRLTSLYGDKFELTLENRKPGEVEASISVPYVCGESR